MQLVICFRARGCEFMTFIVSSKSYAGEQVKKMITWKHIGIITQVPQTENKGNII